MADAVGQRGLHVCIYGERGVGKTSLANILAEIPLAVNTATVRVNCDATDTFESVWGKIADRLPAAQRQAGFAHADDGRPVGFPADPVPDAVLRFMESLPAPAVCIFDEFDRMPIHGGRAFSDLIKSLSDAAIPSTVVLVGVAETVTDLVANHESIERALVQVQMPRMQNHELVEILEKAERQLDVSFSKNAKDGIVQLSQGLPHYTHLLGRESLRAAVRQGYRSVGMRTVEQGIKTAIEGAQETIRDQYAKAVQSSQDALYDEVLLACALARKGDRSSFRAGDVTKPMSTIMGSRYDIPAIARHLKAFCEDPERAFILTRSGRERNYVYRFRNPLMESYVIMRGIAEGRLSSGVLAASD